MGYTILRVLKKFWPEPTVEFVFRQIVADSRKDCSIADAKKRLPLIGRLQIRFQMYWHLTMAISKESSFSAWDKLASHVRRALTAIYEMKKPSVNRAKDS
jgi:hypothetical protein